MVLPDGQRGDADPAPHQERPASVPGRAKALAERADEAKFVAGLELAQAAGPRPHVLDQELKLAPARPQDAEGAGQERALALASPHRSAVLSM